MSAARTPPDGAGTPGTGPGRAVPPPFPDGAALRRWTARRTRGNARGPWALVGNVYSGLLSLVLLGAMLGPRLGSLVPGGSGRVVTGGLGAAGGPGVAGILSRLDPAWLALALLLVVVTLAVGPLRRLGPLFLRPHEAAWWLPLPGDRRTLLLPVARAELAGAVLLGGATVPVVALLAGAGWLPVTAWAALGGAGAGAVLLRLLSEQLRGRADPVLPTCLTLTAMGCLVASAAAGFPRAPVSGAVLAAVGAAIALADAVAWRRLRSGLDSLRDEELLAVVARSFGAHVSLLSLDTRAVGRLLAPAQRPPRARSRMPLGRLASHLPRGLRPVVAVAQADWLLLRRRPHHLVQVGVGLGIALVPLLAGGAGLVGAGAYLLGAWVAVLALAAPARQAWFDGGVDASWPVAPIIVRTGHLLVPGVVMTVWTALALAPLAPGLADTTEAVVGGQVVVAGGSWWAAAGLVLLTGPAWGGAALRSGFRTIPDFSAGLVTSPVGSLPPGAAQMLVSGPDAALVAGATTALLTLGGPASPTALAVQAVASAVVVTWGLLTGRRR